MVLVPPEELQDVLIQDAHGPFSNNEQDAIAKMVQEGFGAWQEFHERFAEQQRLIKEQQPGLARWEDLARFMLKHTDAKVDTGFVRFRFTAVQWHVETADEPAAALSIGGERFICCDTGGAVFADDGRPAQQLGLNVKVVAETLRRLALVPGLGAAYLRPPDSGSFGGVDREAPFGLLAFQRQTVQADPKGGFVEVGVSLHCFLVARDEKPQRIDCPKKRALMLALLEPKLARNPPDAADPLLADLSRYEQLLADELRRPTEQERQAAVRHAVMPVFAAVVAR